MSNRNILCISDLHIPFEHKNALDFCLDVKKKYKCEKVFFMGDIVDLHSCSFHEQSTEGMSAGEEVNIAKNKIKPWAKAFPNADICIGNHDARPFRKASAAGISSQFIKNYNQVWDTPSTWRWNWSFDYQGLLFKHGNRAGIYSHINIAKDEMRATVTAHTHASGGVHFMASHEKLIWGLNCGCLININEYAFHYAKDCTRRPIVGCGVVLDNSTIPVFVPMKL